MTRTVLFPPAIGLRRVIAVALATTAGALAAAPPASATLLVRSDGAGLFVQDKNGLDDLVALDVVPTGQRGAGIDYQVRNNNRGDIFKFDRQVGCSEGGAGDESNCVRNGLNVRVDLLAGNDRLTFDPDFFPQTNVTLTAGSGNDTAGGNLQPDCTFEADGQALVAPATTDNFIGGPGADRFFGCAGNDRLEGGTGNDSLFGGAGVDRLLGGPGTDAITSKEEDGTPAERDRIRCGSGSGDSIVADLRDNIVSGCEQVNRSPVGETPHVRLPGSRLRVGRSGVGLVRLSCPRTTTIGCRGTLSLKLASRGARRPQRTSYSIRAGRSARVAVRLSAAEARRFRSGARGVLTSLERGRIGPKTTIRTPVLR